MVKARDHQLRKGQSPGALVTAFTCSQNSRPSMLKRHERGEDGLRFTCAACMP